MLKPPVNDHETPSVEELYAQIERRFGKSAREPEPVVYEFTDDRGLLHQYYRLREIMYRKVYHTDKFVGEEDVYDKLSHILIARRGRLCIGGCRLIIREADEDFQLPMETSDFKLRGQLSGLPLNKVRHGEISRFAVMDDDGAQVEVMLTLSQLIIEKCINAELGYVFLKTPGLLMARNWRKIARTHCHLHDACIRTDIHMPQDPAYPEIQWQLTQIPLPVKQTPLYHEEKPIVRPVESPIH
jgi:hypothetical protein